MCCAAAFWILGPTLGKVEFPINERMPFRARVGKKDPNLAIFDPSRCPAVLALHTDRLSSLFQEASFIKDQDGRWICHYLTHKGDFYIAPRHGAFGVNQEPPSSVGLALRTDI